MNILSQKSLVVHFALLSIKIRFKGTYFGLIWTALEPLLVFVLLYTVFTHIRLTTQEDFAIYLLTGILFFHIFSRGTLAGLSSLTVNVGLLQSLSLNKDFFPTSSTLGTIILSLIEVGVFVSLLPILGFIPDWTILLLPIPIFLVLVLILGLSFLLSITNIFFKDIQIIWAVLIQALFFITPIFWYLDAVKGILLDVQVINPLTQIVNLAHKIVFGINPTINEWGYAFLLTFIFLFVGYAIFRKFENKITEEL